MTDFSRHKASVTDTRRWTSRHEYKRKGRIVINGYEADCTVVNVSDGGIGITFDSILQPKVGQVVTVTTPELGTVSCTMRWVAQTSAGLEFNAMAKVSRMVKALLVDLSGENGF